MTAPVRPIGALVSGAVLLFLGGCAFGPVALQTNRLKYNEAVRKTWNEQFLLNIVRLRYRDPPQFDAVTNILSSHSFDAGLNSREEDRQSGQIIPKNMFNSNLYNLKVFGGAADISERPTITFSPLEGPEFTKHLLGNIHLETLVLLSSTGWDLDRLLRLAVQEMNHLENVRQVAGARERLPRFEEFTAAARQMRRLQQRNLLELTYDTFDKALSEPIGSKELRPADLLSASDKKVQFHRNEPNQVVLWGKERSPVLRIAAGAWTESCGSAAAAEIAHRLNLVPGQTTYPLIAGAEVGQLKVPPGPSPQLIVSTRSPLGVLLFASKAVEVPPKHLEKGLVEMPGEGSGQAFDWTCVTGDLIRIHSRCLKPTHAFVSVKYRGHWFYIDDNDLNSKSTFALILEIYGLELAGGVIPGPIVTVPIGGGLQVSQPSGGGGSRSASSSGG